LFSTKNVSKSLTMSSLVLRIMISFHHFSGVILVLGKGKICPVPFCYLSK
jgi:hypothetical protein